MLVTNQQLDQLAAAQSNFTNWGMLNRPLGIKALETLGKSPIPDSTLFYQNPTEQKWTLDVAAELLMQLLFPKLMCRFLYDQLYLDSALLSCFILDESLPIIDGKIEVFNSTVAMFNAPSDISDINGMHRKHIQATLSWRNGPACYDTILINSNPDIDGVQGFEIAHVLLFFAFWHHGKHYPCALILWFSFVGLELDQDTGLWIVEPSFDDGGSPFLVIVNIDSIYRAVQLLAAHQDA